MSITNLVEIHQIGVTTNMNLMTALQGSKDIVWEKSLMLKYGSQGMTKVFGINPLGTVDICSKYHGNTSNVI